MLSLDDIQKFIDQDMPSKQAGAALTVLLNLRHRKPVDFAPFLQQVVDICNNSINNGIESLQEQYADAEDSKVTNHPKRYLGKSGIEAIDIIEYVVDDMPGYIAFNIGTAVKYLSRLGKKKTTDEAEDWKKTLWYINRALKLIG